MKAHINRNNVMIGKVVDPWSLCDPYYYVKDPNGILKWVVTADCCQCGLCCRNSFGMCSNPVFPIYPANTKEFKQENCRGTITKTFSGVQEFISDADNFEIVFPPEATAEERLLLIGVVLMIDYEYFEESSGDKNRHHH